MANVRLYREVRCGKICLNFNHHGNNVRRVLPIRVEQDQWDSKMQRVVNHPAKQSLNLELSAMLTRAQRCLFTLEMNEGVYNLSARDVCDKVCYMLFHEDAPTLHLFLATFDEFVTTRQGRTKEVYNTCRNLILDFDRKAAALKLEDITYKWLVDFQQFALCRMSRNTLNIRLRCIRAVFNYALKCEYTQHYPFRKLSIKNTDIIHHDISAGDLERFMTEDIPESMEEGVLVCRLMFYLICPNSKDLYGLMVSNVEHGRVKFIRAKTHKAYNIKVTKDAYELLRLLIGRKGKLVGLAERFATDRAFGKYLNDCLRSYCAYLHIEPFTTNWLRHGWATYALNIAKVPADIISQALGHTFILRTTQTYIKTDILNADDANEAVIRCIKSHASRLLQR